MHTAVACKVVESLPELETPHWLPYLDPDGFAVDLSIASNNPNPKPPKNADWLWAGDAIEALPWADKFSD